MGKKSYREEVIKTVRLSERDQRRIIDQLNSHRPDPDVIEQRRNLRVDYNIGELTVSVTPPRGVVTHYSVVPRNLSTQGLAFIHGQFIYPGSHCKVRLTMAHGRFESVAGKILCCRHVTGVIHEVSVLFDQPIDLSQFVGLPEDQKGRVRRETQIVRYQAMMRRIRNHEPIQAQALVADDNEADRCLLATWLNRKGIDSLNAANGEDVLKVLDDETEQIDLIIIDHHLGDENGMDVVKTIRAKAINTPVIAISNNEDDATRSAFLQAGSTVFLTKPLTPAAFLDTAERAILLWIELRLAEPDPQAPDTVDKADDPASKIEETVDPIFSTLADDSDMKPLIDQFVSGLIATINELLMANQVFDTRTLMALCRQLKGTGGGHGFTPITQTAKTVIEQLEQDQSSADAVGQAVTELVDILKRVRS